MIAFVRSSLFQLDVRAQKYVHFLGPEKSLIIQWDRDLEYEVGPENVLTFKLRAGYGQKLKSLLKFAYWNLFLLKTLFKYRRSYKIIQICDLDSFFPAFFFRLLGKKVVFDVYDCFTDSKLSNTTSSLYFLLYQIEMACLKRADLLILPLAQRERHLNFRPKNLFICENVPLIRELVPPPISFDRNVINVVYAGTLESENRGLEWIPSLAEKLRGKVHFYVAGPGTLMDFFKEADEKHENVTYLGKVSHGESLALQKQGDLIFGIYRTTLLNNVMAAPNKFYESCYLGTPMIINRGLMISETLAGTGIGFVVPENEEGLLHFLREVSPDAISAVSARALDFWKERYQNYLEQKYQTEYQIKLERLIRM